MSYKRQEPLTTLRGHLSSPTVFDGVRVTHFLSFLCCVFCFVSLRPMSCVPNVASISGLSSSHVLCTQCCQYLWIVHSWLFLPFSLTFIYLVYTTLPVSLDCSFFILLRFSLTFIYQQNTTQKIKDRATGTHTKFGGCFISITSSCFQYWQPNIIWYCSHDEHQCIGQ